MAEPEDPLAEVQEAIDEARSEAEDDGLVQDPTPKQTFADPDGDGDVDPPNVIGV
jgi:hypothetical protein